LTTSDHYAKLYSGARSPAPASLAIGSTVNAGLAVEGQPIYGPVKRAPLESLAPIDSNREIEAENVNSFQQRNFRS